LARSPHFSLFFVEPEVQAGTLGICRNFSQHMGSQIRRTEP
jgi:hypothetical protein